MVLNLFLPSFLTTSSQRSLDYSAWFREDHLNMSTFPFELDACEKALRGTGGKIQGRDPLLGCRDANILLTAGK